MEPIVFVDMDGTFLCDDKTISVENRKLIDWLYDRNIMVVPATGRPLQGIPIELLEHPCVSYAICSNGALIYKLSTREIIYEQGMSHQDVLDLYHCFAHLDIQFDVFADNHIYAERKRMEHILDFPIETHMLPYILKIRTQIEKTIPEYLSSLHRIDRLNIFFKNKADCDEMYQILKQHFPHLNALSSLKNNIEITSLNAHKGNAMQWLVKYINRKDTYTIAFGDSTNDITMLKMADDAVAMDNAIKACKDEADHITSSNNDSGVAKYLYNKLK